MQLRCGAFRADLPAIICIHARQKLLAPLAAHLPKVSDADLRLRTNGSLRCHRNKSSQPLSLCGLCI